VPLVLTRVLSHHRHPQSATHHLQPHT
jgi:hypothetical protein